MVMPNHDGVPDCRGSSKPDTVFSLGLEVERLSMQRDVARAEQDRLGRESDKNLDMFKVVEKEVTTLKALLADLEWVPKGHIEDDEDWCPCCLAYKSGGHDNSCRLGKALK